METEVELIIKRIKKRKPEALETVIDRYMGTVYNLAKTILTSKEDIEECVQDTFFDVWNKINEYNLERGSFKTWILIICKFKALDKRRSYDSNVENIELNESDIRMPYHSEPENHYLHREESQEILTMINHLKPIDRELFIRRYVLEQSVYDICEVMGLTRQAVDNRLWRGKKQLREYFKIKEGK